MCTYVPVHMCMGACGHQKRASDALVLALQESMNQCGWLEQNLSPLQVKHSLVSTEPFLQPLEATICIRGPTITGW